MGCDGLGCTAPRVMEREDGTVLTKRFIDH